MTILLVGANERAAYSLAKSYSKKGYKVTVLNDAPHPIQFSRFVNHFVTVTASFEKETDKAVIEILAFLQKNKFDCTVPVNDVALTICFQFYESIAAFTKLLFVNKASTHIFCRDKAALLSQCKQLGIPSPNSTLIQKLSDLNTANIQFPCIAKPVSSKVYSNGKIFSYTVKKINTKEQLIDFIREKIETVPVMVQEILQDGYGVGYNFLSVNGEVLNAYAHERINEAWGGGQSTYRKTINPTQYNLEAYSKKLIAAIGWTGIAMIEYRIVNNEPYIMEINGRSWGSIELGIFAGCNLPADMVTVLFKNEPLKKFNFESPVYARNLFNEAIWVIQSKSIKVFFKWLWNLKNVVQKNQLIEDNPFKDFRFRIAFIAATANEQLKKLSGKIKRRFFLPSINVITKQKIHPGLNIAFICKGNINRSAFAEYYVKKMHTNYTVTSYGTVFEENRLSPVNAIEAAAQWGINLDTHRSKYLTQKAISDTELFIIMDKINFTDLCLLNIPANKIFLLNKEGITDPYSHEIDFFKKTFAEIANNLNLIFE